MRKIIRTLSTITGRFERYNLSSHINKVRDGNKSPSRAYHQSQRVERKLLMLKRATLLSYISIACTQEMRASLQFETRDRLIDYLICNGHAEDCASAYEVRY
jgi:hypothetical protein